MTNEYGVTPDPEYDLVPPLPPQKRGQQCGRCGMKFEYGVSYGYHCSTWDCPMQVFVGSSSGWVSG